MAPSSLSASTTSTSCVSATSATSLYLPQTYSFLSPETFETLVEGYINQLHIRKRNKALISQQLANDCLMVLTNPENTAIFNPKFRWWVRKHFVFTVVGELRILMDKKNGKPVCVREQLYDKVCYFHHIIGHGGRDKTFAAITKSYSKVPAELVSLFTKNCQTCLGVRKYSKNKRPILNEFEYTGQHQHSAQTHHSQRQQQQQQQQQLQQQQHSQQHHQQYIQQPHPSHPTHPHHLQLTCNTSFFSSNAHHQQQQQPQQQQNPYSMLTKMEHGIMSPISPLLNHSGSSFFGSAHLQPTYHAQSQPEQQQQQQQPSQQPHQDQQHQPHHPSQQMHQQQMQQHHHAALATHLNMSMSLSGMSLGGHLDTSSSSSSSSTNSNGLSVTTTTPTIITKMDIPFHQLMQQQQSHNNAHQLINTGLHSPTDLQDHPFASHHHHPHQHQHQNQQQQHQQQSSPAPSIDCYSPTLHQHYMPQQQHSQHSQQQQQQQQQQNDLYSDSFTSYSAALALNNFQHQPTYPTHETSSSSSSQPDQDEDPSPLLTSTQMFQKQIQQEHYQYQQQQHQQQQHPRSFLEESLLVTHLTASTSSAHSAVPSMSHCAEMCSAETLSSIPTPMSCSSSSPLTSMLESHGHAHHPNHHDLDQSDAADLDLDQNHVLQQQQQQHQHQQQQQHHQELMAMEQQYRELAAVSKHELQGLHHALQARQEDDDDDEIEDDDNNEEETISMEKCPLTSAVADLVAQI